MAVAKRNWRPYGGSLDSLHYNGGDSILFMPVLSLPYLFVISLLGSDPLPFFARKRWGSAFHVVIVLSNQSPLTIGGYCVE